MRTAGQLAVGEGCHSGGVLVEIPIGDGTTPGNKDSATPRQCHLRIGFHRESVIGPMDYGRISAPALLQGDNEFTAHWAVHGGISHPPIVGQGMMIMGKLSIAAVITAAVFLLAEPALAAAVTPDNCHDGGGETTAVLFPNDPTKAICTCVGGFYRDQSVYGIIELVDGQLITCMM